ncbi:cysteine-rich CWC family protein [Candidatus Marsarchaeota archaeon]|nr:cysteine-rich CWC family protein [Candidatus Marsarchaeota archaeon]MCL5404807.1 cysteine-rich CWC family protein [Candidatus Marsarchaeota archaeon]
MDVKCGICGKPFECMGIGFRRCWCAGVKLDKHALKLLKRSAKGCVCRSCLERLTLKTDDKAINI